MRGTGQYRGTEILHDHDLALGVATGDRNNRCPELFCTVVGAETAGKQAVTVGVVDDIPSVHPCGYQGTGHQLTPGFDVRAGIAHHCRFAGGSG